MQGRIPLGELNQDLSQALQKMDVWSKETVARAKKLRAVNKENQDAHKGFIVRLSNI